MPPSRAQARPGWGQGRSRPLILGMPRWNTNGAAFRAGSRDGRATAPMRGVEVRCASSTDLYETFLLVGVGDAGGEFGTRRAHR